MSVTDSDKLIVYPFRPYLRRDDRYFLTQGNTFLFLNLPSFVTGLFPECDDVGTGIRVCVCYGVA